MLAVEIVGGFDYQQLKVEQRVFVQQQFYEIKGLLRKQVYNAIEIGQKLVDVKERLGYGLYLGWIESEFAWQKSAAYRFEQVALAFGQYASDFPIWEKFDLSALYLLASPSVSEEIRHKAIGLANSGERVSHARAKALKAGTDTPIIQAGATYTVGDETSPFYGQKFTVEAIDKKDGIVKCTSVSGASANLLVSELISQPLEPSRPPKKEQPNHVSAIAAQLEIERERVQLLEAALRKLLLAARSGKFSDKLLTEAESLI